MISSLRSWLIALLATAAGSAAAETKLPSIFSDHMVLQRGQENRVWGWDKPGTEVTVTFAGATSKAKADANGRWEARLPAMKESAESRTLSVQGSSKKDLTDVLVGEVWVCSGQSNMGFTVSSCWDADLEIATANYPNLRLISVPNVGSQKPLDDFTGAWERCSPKSVGSFSAVGYFFGLTIQKMINVPVGLIDNAWGGSSAEAWVRRDLLEKDPRFATLMADWKNREATFDMEAAKAAHAKAMADWKKQADAAKAANQFAPKPPRAPQDILKGQHRPGNLYGGCLHPILGYGIRGVVWYQGESNSGRAYEYRTLFPLMIQHWRDEWKQGDFPFYWVQLADYLNETPEPGDSAWAELREAQTLSQKALPHTGQAVIIDLGEASDIHPKNKRDVGERLDRWALAKDYGMKTMPYHSPELKDAQFANGRATVTLTDVGTGLRTVDANEVQGFAICGKDRKWHNAQARLLPGQPIHQVQVWSPDVKEPVAVRYAWANNPVCNLYTTEGLPVTPFRSDDFPMVTQPATATK